MQITATGSISSQCVEVAFEDRSSQSPALELAPSVQDTWDEIIGELNAMRRLTDDWDGLGASAPRNEIIDSAVEWGQHLRRLGRMAPASVLAGPRGTILFNWQDENGYLDAEVARPHYVEWMWIVPGRPTQHGAFDYVPALGGQWNSTSQQKAARTKMFRNSASAAMNGPGSFVVSTLRDAVEQLKTCASVPGTV